MHRDTFNADFYIVAATVIPVLFLAVTLQGPTYERILNSWRVNAKKAAEADTSTNPLATLLVAASSYVAAIVILLMGFGSEADAILALYRRRSATGLAFFVLFTIMTLMATVAFGPLAQFLRTLSAVWLNRRPILPSPRSEHGKVGQTQPSAADTD